jgi:hypothetical protein
MTFQSNLLEEGLLFFAKAFQNLVETFDASDVEYRIRVLCSDLGWTLPDTVPRSLFEFAEAVVTLSRKLRQFEDLKEGGKDRALVTLAGADLASALIHFAQLQSKLPPLLADQLPQDFISATNLPSLFSERLYGFLIVNALTETLPIQSSVLRILGILEATCKQEDLSHFQPKFVLRRFNWNRLEQLALNPGGVFEEVYGWGTPSINTELLLELIFCLSRVIGYPGKFDYPSQKLIKAIAPTIPNPEIDRSLKFTLFGFNEADASLLVTTVPKASVFEPQAIALAIQTSRLPNGISVPLSYNRKILLKSTLDASGGVALVLFLV